MPQTVTSATYGSQVTSAVQLDAATTPAAANTQSRTVSNSGFDTTKSFDPLTSPPVSIVANWNAVLVAGALVIDLTALPGITGNQDASAKKLQVFKLINPSANPVTVTADATNGYLLFGTAGSVVVPAGGEIAVYLANVAPTIDSTHKRISLAGTSTDTFKVTVFCG